jgi:hypothetical protein
MTRREDLTGRRFGRVTVLRFYDLNGSRNAYWLCKCDCGTEFIALGCNLKRGYTKSCGCYRSEATKERNLKRFRHNDCCNLRK